MLPGLGVTEIVALAVLALLVVGPRDLPLMMRKLGKWTAKLRAMANEFRSGFDELARQAELDELKREVDALRRANPLNELRTPLQDLNRDIQRQATAAPTPPPPALPPLPADPGPVAPAQSEEVQAEAKLELEANPEPPRVASGGQP